jgi:hypothetical protein
VTRSAIEFRSARERDPMSYIYVVQMDVPAALEGEFNRIYDEEHVPTILKVPAALPGDLRGRQCCGDRQPGLDRGLRSRRMEAEDPAAYDEPPAQRVRADRLTPIPANPGGPAMPYIFVVQLDIPAADDAEFNRIYDAEHFPMLSKVPGVRSAARYRLAHSTLPGMARYLTIYELDSPAVMQSEAWEKAGAYGDWVAKIRPKLTSRQHSVFEHIA